MTVADGLAAPVAGAGRSLVGAFGTIRRTEHARPPLPGVVLPPPPRVSVVIPCYRYGHYLEGCVQSALQQRDVDIDVLIVDDASPDGSGEVAEAIAARDPRVRVLRHATNLGHLATYNEGLSQIDGTYVVLLSADDQLTPGALARATALFQAHPSVGLVYGRPLFLTDGCPPPVPQLEPSGWTIWPGRVWLEQLVTRAVNCIFSPEVVMRTDVLQAIGAYRPELPHAGDYEMWLRAAIVADVGYIRGAHQACYRVHEANMHRSGSGHLHGEHLLTDIEQRRLSHELALAWAGDGLDGDRLSERGRQALAREALTLACRAYAWGHTETWPVDRLEALARSLHPAADRLREARSLTWRRRLGPTWSRRNPGYRAQNLLDRASEARDQRRWERTGLR